MHPDLIITTIILVVNSIVALVILFQNPRKELNRIFFATLFSIVLWKLTLSIYLGETNSSDLVLWGRINFSVALLIGYFAVRFANVFPDKLIYIQNKSFSIILNVVTAILFLLTVFTPLVSQNELISAGLKETIFGPLYPIYGAYILFSILFSIYILIRKYGIYKDKVKKQIFLVVIGFIVASVFVFLTNIILPFFFENFELQIWGPIGTLALTFTISYAIFKYNFLDIRLYAGKLIYLGLSGVIVLILYYVALFIDLKLFNSPLAPEGLIVGIPFTMVFVLVYENFRSFVQRRIVDSVINPNFNPTDVLIDYNKKISTILDQTQITDLLFQTIAKTIQPEMLDIFIMTGNHTMISTQEDDNRILDIFFQKNIIDLWEASDYMPVYLDQIELEVPRVFSKNFLQLSPVIEKMKKDAIRLLIPIGSKGKLNGIVTLGNKEDSVIYNSLQINFIDSLCETTDLALIRSNLYEEVEEFNETLQTKIKDATEEINHQNQKLSESLRIERDMLDVLGHELRTPLGTIRNSMGVMEIKYKSGQLQPADLENFLRIATENIRREIQLLETILASAKIDNDKLDLNFEKVDASDVVSDSFEAYKFDAEKKGLKLIYNKTEDQIYVYADRLRIQQVMDNLTNNAVKYTRTGEVELRLEDKGKYINFSVTDTGEGIPAEDIPKLGTKFFRANMYLQSNGKLGDRQIIRPGGTGIGLYVVFQIVKFMFGEVKVTSTLGKGSTFEFTVLKYTDELANRSNFILAGKDSVRTYN